MANPRGMEVRRFMRAAAQHLADAATLRNAGSVSSGAMYLAGYAVECGLKAVLLANVPVGTQANTLQSFRGAKAHDYDWLTLQLRRRNVHLSAAAADALSKVDSWSVELRYSPGDRKAKETDQFLTAAAVVLDWAR